MKAVFAALLIGAAGARAQELFSPEKTLAALKSSPAAAAVKAVNPKLRAGDPPVAADVLAALPGRNTGHKGRPADPLTVVFLGSADQLTAALSGAGWRQVPLGDRAAIEQGLEDTFWHNRRPPNLPFHLYWINGKREDYNWAYAKNLNTRHHFRLWRMPWTDAQGRELWWGSADYDVKIRFRDFSHMVDPDIDAELGFIKDSLQTSSGVDAMWVKVLPQVPRQVKNDFGYTLRSDGSVLFVGLGAAPQAAQKSQP